MAVFGIALALAFLPAACAGPESGLRLEVSSSMAYPTRLIAIYPVGLRFEAPAYRSYELAMEVVSATLSSGRFMVLGPSEFQVLRWDVDRLYAATTLSGQLAKLGLRPGNLLGLRTWVEKREQSGAQQLWDAHGMPRGTSRSAQVTYVVHAELLGPDVAQPVAEAAVDVSVDAFADHPAWDDTPELRVALRRLTARLFDRLGAQLQTIPQPKHLPFEAEWVPWDEEAFAMPGHPPLRVQLEAEDAVTAEATRLLRLSYFNADLPPNLQTTLLALPAGLWVRKVPRLLQAAGLEVGDVVTHVEDEPVVGPQTLLRWQAVALPGASLHVRVWRAGEHLHLTIPAHVQ